MTPSTYFFKAVQTIHGGVSSAIGRSPLTRDVVGSIPGSRADARERMDDLREEIASLTDGKMKFETGWRGQVSFINVKYREIQKYIV